MNAYTAVPFDRFPGLRLLPEQAEAQGAVTMLNVELNRDLTQIGSRGGLSRIGTGTATYHRISPWDASNLMVFRNTGAAASGVGVAISTGTFSAAVTWGSASTIVTSTVLTGTDELLIAARSGAANETAQITQAGPLLTPFTLSGPINVAPRYVAVTPYDQRVVLAHFTATANTPSGSQGTTSTIFFSNPEGSISGSPSILNGRTTFGVNDWINLDPQDGDEITGVVSWRELLFVVKRSAVYVFYGTSTDSTGGAIFNYRKIDLPSRTRATTNRGGGNIVAAADGVYLLCADGVYRTTGGVPQLVSHQITPIFDGTGDASMVFPSSGDWTIGYAANRVYLNYVAGGNQRTLVYDCVLGEWLLWNFLQNTTTLPTNIISWVNANGLPVAYFASGASIYSLSSTATADDATAITSNYQYGFFNMGSQAQKRVRQSHLWGSGAPTWSLFTDYGTTDSRAASVTLGTSPAIAEGYDRQARRGKLFSFKLSATSPWVVTRLVLDVAAPRDEALKGA